ncbi:MAG: pseudouridine synthase [Oscillospiraceae bacterium]|nr:pseudouridine synthase [Oscillospiraceae bacterium]
MKTERLDKIIGARTSYSRKEAKSLIAKGRCLLNGKVAKGADTKVDLERDTLTLDGQELLLKEHLYLMLNKPAGVLSAARDPKQPTVIDLVPEHLRRTGLFPAGRLDKDTEGFVLITDDGGFAHRILSPKRHVEKTYEARLDGPVTEEMIRRFSEGVRLDEETLCLPALLRVLEEGEHPLAEVVIVQGMYHQVKRMFEKQGRQVLHLKRTAIGALRLDPQLACGEAREILDKELDQILDKTEAVFPR